MLGLSAIEKYGFSPFIDGSCRREPDFENPYPSISSLCRQSVFAPHLQENDIIIYITVGGKFKPYKEGHHLVAILQVEEVYDSHEIAWNEYKKRNLPLPSNCMVSNNLPLDFDKTSGDYKSVLEQKKFLSRNDRQKMKIGEKRLRLWDKNYQKKSKEWPCFIKTKPIYINLINPIQILRSDFNSIFGKLPNTRMPKKINKEQLIRIGRLAGLEINILPKA